MQKMKLPEIKTWSCGAWKICFFVGQNPFFNILHWVWAEAQMITCVNAPPPPHLCLFIVWNATAQAAVQHHNVCFLPALSSSTLSISHLLTMHFSPVCLCPAAVWCFSSSVLTTTHQSSSVDTAHCRIFSVWTPTPSFLGQKTKVFWRLLHWGTIQR